MMLLDCSKATRTVYHATETFNIRFTLALCCSVFLFVQQQNLCADTIIFYVYGEETEYKVTNTVVSILHHCQDTCPEKVHYKNL